MQPTETLKPKIPEMAKSQLERQPIAEKAKLGEGKEKNPQEKLRVPVGDMIRDILTASDMAKEKFDGDSALMHAARGTLTTALGIGLEKAIDGMWQKGFAGQGPLIQRPWLEISEKALVGLEKVGKKYPFIYYMVREGSKDLMTGLMYNGIAFFSRPMLPSIEGKHLVGSAFVNVVESFIESPEYIRKDIEIAPGNREKISSAVLKKDDLNKIILDSNDVIRPFWREKPLKLFGLSNPPTWLGVNMIINAWNEIKENYDKVHNVRVEKGGLPGKKVVMPKEQRRWEDKKKDTVYYGKARWQEEKPPKKPDIAPEEELLEKFG